MAKDKTRYWLSVYAEERETRVFLEWVERTLGPYQKEPEIEGIDYLSYAVQVSWDSQPVHFMVNKKVDFFFSEEGRGCYGTARVPPDPVRDVRTRFFILLEFAPPPPMWATHVDLGRQLSQALDVDVICDPGDHYPTVSPYSDTLLLIRRTHEELILLDEPSEEEEAPR